MEHQPRRTGEHGEEAVLTGVAARDGIGQMVPESCYSEKTSRGGSCIMQNDWNRMGFRPKDPA